ncbi:WXG100 family type VII secretion target [Cellulomonas composti]|uniref:ESAT-6-like protein n=1 Tax=Cellulomonas composti TaxID=266130 RepID=A0A511J7V9_9CELL|nr:WXG100 family type VII secretion target [Cellulomonas composti]GEL94082.1 hypothetical protein CCO02nite_07400 [Cellulomonas composti]
MAVITVDPDDLEDLAVEMRKSADRMQASLDDLATGIRSLARDWTGAASDAFQVAEATWSTSMTDARVALDTAADLLSAAAGIYTETESDVVARCS